jgi:membrane protein
LQTISTTDFYLLRETPVQRRKRTPMQTSHFYIAGHPAHAVCAAWVSWRAQRDLLKRVFASWNSDGGPRLGAAIAFYAVFSLAPLLAMAVLVAGTFMGLDTARAQFLGQVGGLVGESGSATLGHMIDSAMVDGKGWLAAGIGLLTLFIGTTGVFLELRNALDFIFRHERARGLSRMVRARLTSFALVLAVGFLTLVSLMASAALAAFGTTLSERFPVLAGVAIMVNALLPLALITVLFGMLMRWLPSARLSWRKVLPGAFFSAALFELGKQLLGLYLGRAAFSSAFGAAGALVVVMMWVYYCAQVLLLGAEYNKVRLNLGVPTP